MAFTRLIVNASDLEILAIVIGNLMHKLQSIACCNLNLVLKLKPIFLVVIFSRKNFNLLGTYFLVGSNRGYNYVISLQREARTNQGNRISYF